MNKVVMLGAVCASLVVAGVAAAQSTGAEGSGEPVAPVVVGESGAPSLPSADDKWRFRLTPYFWLGAMNGDLTVKGRSISIHQDVKDVANMLDDHMNFGACLHFEAEKGRWGVIADALYLDLTGEHTGPLGNVVQDIDSQQFLGELSGFYTAIEPRQRSEGVVPIRLDLIAGLRVTWLDNSINPTLAGTVQATKAWVDPLVGARVVVHPTDWLSLSARADVGGFGLAESVTSDFSWQAIVGANFRLTEAMSLDIGWKWLSQDYQDGSGLSAFRYDVTTSGPYIGVTFRW